MKRKKSGEKRRTPSAVAALGGKPIEIARIDGDAEAWLAVFADRIAVATDKETEERHWFEFERATWSGNTLTMPFVDWNIPAFELKLADGEEDIALVVRERLERSIVVRRISKLPSGAEVRAMVRRDDKDDLFTQVIIDGRAKEEDEEAIAELEETLRDIVGLEPDGDEGRGIFDEPSPESDLRADDADAAGRQTSLEGPEGARADPGAVQVDIEAAEKSQSSTEADVASQEPLAAAQAPETVKASEAAEDAGANEAVGSANEPEAGVAAAAQAADGAFSGEASEPESSAGASDAPGRLAVPESEAKPESAPEPESPAESEDAAASESPSSPAEGAPAPESEPEPESLTPSGVEASPGASEGIAKPAAAGGEESSADASSNSPRDGVEQPSAADPAMSAHAATSADAASPASAAESDAKGSVPDSGTPGSEPEASERGTEAPERGKASST